MKYINREEVQRDIRVRDDGIKESLEWVSEELRIIRSFLEVGGQVPSYLLISHKKAIELNLTLAEERLRFALKKLKELM